MNEKLPALSLRQPWAWAIFHSDKTIENRTWGTSYRGRIRIHAAKTWDDDGYAFISGEMGLIVPSEFQMRDEGMMGAYVGEVTVLDCCRFSPCLGHDHGAWAFGPICWILEDPIAYPKPKPGRGYPGLYYPDRFAAKGQP